MNIKKQEKLFKEPEEQITILEEERNLTIDDKERAISLLTRINYYNLINGYKRPFLDHEKTREKNEDWYRDGVNLKDLYSLYKFDKNISGVIFPVILRIESEIKTILSSVISSKTEDAHKDSVYLRLGFFDTDNLNNKRERELLQLIERLNQYIDKEDCQPYIKHYKTEHKYVPLWVLTNAITFGDMTLYYKYLTQKDKHSLVRTLEKSTRIDPNHFYYILQMMRIYRNKLAHDETFYSYKARNRKGYRYTVKFNGFNGIRTQETSVYTLIVSFKLILCEEDYDNFRELFLKFLLDLSKSIDEIAFKYVLNDMGFNDGDLKIESYDDVVKYI